MRCWTQASKPEPLKQDAEKGKDNRYSDILYLPGGMLGMPLLKTVMNGLPKNVIGRHPTVLI